MADRKPTTGGTMPYVKGDADITIHPDGRREVTTSNLVVVQGDKPRTLEASGSDPEVWKQLRAGMPGTYRTPAHFGGATALLVLRKAIALPDPNFLDQMTANFGNLGEDALLGAVRTGSAAATQFCVDTVGGMFTSLERDYETLAAMLKILPLQKDGWVRILLPPKFAHLQGRFDDAQRHRWAVTRPGFQQKHEARINFMPIGQDRFDGESTLVVFGPLGDCQFIRIVRLVLEGEGFCFCDGEWRTGRKDAGEGELVPLHRKIVATVTCAKHPGIPLILELHPDGHLHQGGLHVFVEGPLSRRLLSHNPIRGLGPHGLGWLAA